jgi:hypothetical protein
VDHRGAGGAFIDDSNSHASIVQCNTVSWQ